MLRRLTPTDSPDLLVGTETGDDAAVWRLDDDRALVVTADFITPLVDDARDWGRIAAANAVSDVYAMGGRPLLALNLVGWNRDELSLDVLGDVLDGAAEVAREGRFAIAGGTPSTTPSRSTAWPWSVRSTPTGSSPTPACAPATRSCSPRRWGSGSPRPR